jgi:hypothetical protein
MVGIIRFSSDKKDHAVCTLVAPYEETFLFSEEDGVEFENTFKPCTHVQVNNGLHLLSLELFEFEELAEIPDLVYEPQKEGAWRQFAYYFSVKHVRVKSRKRPYRV